MRICALNNTNIGKIKNSLSPSCVTFAGNSLQEDSFDVNAQQKLLNGKISFSRIKKFMDTNSFDPNFVDQKTGEHWLIPILKQKTLFNKNDKKEVVQKILEHESFDPNFITSDGITPLYIAIRNSNKNNSDIEDLGIDFLKHKRFDPNMTFETTEFDENGNASKVSTNYFKWAIKHFDHVLIFWLCCDNRFRSPSKTELEAIDYDKISLVNVFMADILKSYAMKVYPDLALGATKKSKIISTKIVHNGKEYLSSGLSKYLVDISDNVPNSVDKIGGFSQAKKDVENYILKPWNPHIRSMLLKNNVELPNGFLMYGPPGCGKTYMTEVIAKQTGYPMYEVNLANVGSSLAHATVNEMNYIFEELHKQFNKSQKPSILFLDEIDSLLVKRSNASADYRQDEINTMLRLLNKSAQKGIIVIGATNFLENIDEAALRTGRFDKQIKIDFPTFSERKEILEKLIENKEIANKLLQYLDNLAKETEGKTCSDLNVIINTCARNAIYSGRDKVELEDFYAVLNELDKDKKISKRNVGFNN